MSPNKIIIEVAGRTFILPTNAVFSFDTTGLEVYAPNFIQKFKRANIQDISLLTSESATESDLQLLERLKVCKSEEKKKKKTKKVKLSSGMI